MILQIFYVFWRESRLSISVEVGVGYRLVSLITSVYINRSAPRVFKLVRIVTMHLSEMIFGSFILLFGPASILFSWLNINNIIATSQSVIVRKFIIALIMGKFN